MPTRLRTPSFCWITARWFFTVPAAMNNAAAISALVRPLGDQARDLTIAPGQLDRRRGDVRTRVVETMFVDLQRQAGSHSDNAQIDVAPVVCCSCSPRFSLTTSRRAPIRCTRRPTVRRWVAAGVILTYPSSTLRRSASCVRGQAGSRVATTRRHRAAGRADPDDWPDRSGGAAPPLRSSWTRAGPRCHGSASVGRASRRLGGSQWTVEFTDVSDSLPGRPRSGSSGIIYANVGQMAGRRVCRTPPGAGIVTLLTKTFA
jgi:hypothetical protein